MKRASAALSLVLLSACSAPAPQPVDVIKATKQCEARARAAAAPTGGVEFGYNSETGPSTGFVIGLSSDFLARRTPEEVFERCVLAKTGAPAYRAATLSGSVKG